MIFRKTSTQYLYEGLDLKASSSMYLWESAGHRIVEAALTADQIQQIFTSAEQGATAGGANRTMLGKGKDAADAVNKAWEDLKSKAGNSAPIKNVDGAYDSVVAKIEAGLGGPDNAVSKIIMGYRKFAKEHPIAQGLIYSALIAAAGISTAGLGGAAVVGLLKLTDKLLQGEKFSSAAYSGAKTGAMAYGASKLGDFVKGKIADKDAVDAMGDAQDLRNQLGAADVAGAGVKAARDQASNAAVKAVQDALANGADPRLTTELAYIGQSAAEKFSTLQGGLISVQSAQIIGMKAAAQAIKAAAGTESALLLGKKLSEGQVYMIFNRIAATNNRLLSEGVLSEGPLDAIKGLAGKAMNKVKTIGTNFTTKVTADKLNSTWKAAGSPLESGAVADILKQAGVADDVVSKVYTDLKIPTAGAAPAVDPKKVASMYAQVKTELEKLDSKSKQQLMTYLQKQLGTA